MCCSEPTTSPPICGAISSALDRHPSNSYVTQLAVRTLAGNAYTVRARYFVLALGGIENARMLLLSNAIEAAGLGNQHGLVGRYFMEHIRYWSGVILPANQAEVVDLYGRASLRERSRSAWSPCSA
jgi:hypothetical protein